MKDEAILRNRVFAWLILTMERREFLANRDAGKAKKKPGFYAAMETRL